MGERTAGGCLCGATRFFITGAPRWVAHCHCQSCRRATGAPITTYVGFTLQHFAWAADAPPGFASSPGVLRRSCATCASPLSYESRRWPGEIHVHLGALDRPQDYPPAMHVYVEERIDWLEVHDALPRYQGVAGRGAMPVSHGPLHVEG